MLCTKGKPICYIFAFVLYVFIYNYPKFMLE